MKKGCQCVDCEHRDYCNKRNKGGVVQCINYNKGKAMTEQDWIQTATTEQLAEFLTKVILDERRFRMTMIGGVNETKLWLKQPHREVNK